jgi:hypothetical protein
VSEQDQQRFLVAMGMQIEIAGAVCGIGVLDLPKIIVLAAEDAPPF